MGFLLLFGWASSPSGKNTKISYFKLLIFYLESKNSIKHASRAQNWVNQICVVLSLQLSDDVCHTSAAQHNSDARVVTSMSLMRSEIVTIASTGLFSSSSTGTPISPKRFHKYNQIPGFYILFDDRYRYL